MANKVIVKGNIGNALHSVAPDHITTTADEIFDENLQQYQEDINAARQQADQTLQGNIDAEEAARQQADQTLQGNIDALLLPITTRLAAGYIYMGLATVAGTPETSVGKVFYLTATAGTYTNYGNLTVNAGIAVLSFNGSAWSVSQLVVIDSTPTQNSDALITSGGVHTSITQENTRALAAETASAEFNSTTKRLIFKNAAGMALYEMDATPFIVDGMVDNVEISNGNLVITFNTDAGKQDISIPLTAIFNPANYYNKTEIDARTAALSAQNGYYECNTAAGTADKAVTITGFVMPINGGSIKIKMANANTAASGVKLVINNDNVNAKPLYYNGSVVSVSNTWDAGEVIEVYYNPSVNNNSGAWMANNVNGVFDGVFDVSQYNASGGEYATYDSLSDLLTNHVDDIPTARRKGGMSIKFVQTSDNKYVQYRLMATSFSTDAADWQGVDDKPTTGSKNFVESGGVATLFEFKPQITQGRGIKKVDGMTYESSGTGSTPYIALAEGADLYVKGITGNIATALALYGSDYSFIEAEQSEDIVSETWSHLQSIGAKYYRCTFSSTQIANNDILVINAKDITHILNSIKDVETRTILYAGIGLQDKKVSLLGDSNFVYSDVSSRYGPCSDCITDVRETWWGRVLHATGSHLEVNASMGSSSVTDNEYYGKPGYLDRVDDLGNPDVVIIGGGLNEPPTVTVGTFNPNKPIENLDTMVFADAYDKMIRLINSYYNNPRIIAVLHPKTKDSIASTIIEIDTYYSIEFVDLREIADKITYIDNVHYNQQDANVISEFMLNRLTLETLGYYNNVDKLNKLDINAVKEEPHLSSDDDVINYLTDKNKVIIGKIRRNGAVEWLVKNTMDEQVDTKIGNIDNFLSYVSSELSENVDGIVKYITDIKGNIIATISDSADVEFKGGGGFAGEITKTQMSNIDAVKMLTDKKGNIIGWIDSNATVHLHSLVVKNIECENTEFGISSELLSFLTMAASGIENHKIVSDKTIAIIKALTKDYEREGFTIDTYPVISIMDDDAYDLQLPESYNTSATEETEPIAVNSDRGGFASLLFPVLQALNEKYASTIKGKLTCGVATEGQRIGLTPLYGMVDTFDGTLNSSGKMIKSLIEKEGWECHCHSMTARYITNSYLVNGLDSEFANSLLVGATYSGTNGLAPGTTTCYDTVTKKNYKVKQDLSGWDECPVHMAHPYCAVSKEANSRLVINPSYSDKYQVQTWIDRCNEAGLKHSNAAIGWGTSHTSHNVLEDQKYIDTVIISSSNKTNKVPFHVSPTRNVTEPTPAGSGITSNTDYYNVYNKYDYSRLKAVVDDCVANNSWSILRGHMYSQHFYNGYSSYFTDLYGQDSQYCGNLCYKDNNYPQEWIAPLKHDELIDMMGDNTHDYWNNPPSRLNISHWSEWYPCPGTSVAMLYDILEYAILQGVSFERTQDVLDRFGNVVGIGYDTAKPIDIEERIDDADKVKFSVRIGADNSYKIKFNN